jgi:uncharacterized repeat protein (TIGR03803 family)
MLNLPKYLPRICRTMTALGIALAFTPGVHAQTQTWGLTNRYIFQGGISGPDGGTPYGGVVIGNDGNYYGTTWYGGTGGGTVFKITPTGTESIVYAFSGSQDGQLPFTPVQGPDGNFYGTTLWGGGSNGYGIIFKVTPSGEETILQSLTNTNGGPANPAAGYGTVFKVSATGVLSVLHAFTGGSDGAQPAAPLIHGRDGAFYGTTQAGGTGDCAFPGLPTGCGTVFRVTSAGKESVIHEFAGYPTDGSNPLGGLVQAKDGTLYGTTQAGGFTTPGNCSSGCGTIFSLTPTGTEQILIAFGTPEDQWYVAGWAPSGTLLLSAHDTLTGTTQNGGGGWGNLFSIEPVPAVKLTATPATIALHESTELKWKSTHAKSCEATDGWNGTEPVNGRQGQVPAATGLWTYTLTCTGIGGTVSASAIVTVTP